MQNALYKIKVAATDFFRDQYQLARMQSLDLNNFGGRGYRSACRSASLVAYERYKDESEKYSYFRRTLG